MTLQALFLSNGQTAVFENGQQVPHLQQPWLLLYAKFLEEQGVDPLTVEMRLACGRAVFFKTDSGYNWEIS